jgi:hypothetical protein
MTEEEVRVIAQSIVTKAKATARVDQGTLKRSIAFTYIRGEVTFRQIYWGQYGDNSQLEKLANQYMPFGVPYKIVLTELGGGTFEKGKTKQGRATQKKALASTTKSMTKKYIAQILKKRKKEDGEKEE